MVRAAVQKMLAVDDRAFLGAVRADTAAGKVRSLMMPVRDGMLALQMPEVA